VRITTSTLSISLAGATFIAIVSFFANFGVLGPMIQADEGCYLANAAAIAGFQNDLASSYHAGYSFLIAPAFWLGDGPASVWLWVKVINSILLGSVFILLFVIANQIAPNIPKARRAAAAFVVTMYPMLVVMSGYSFSEIAYVPFFLLTTYALLLTWKHGSHSWILLGLSSGYLYWIHPKAAVVVLAVIFAGAYMGYRRREWRWWIAMASIAILMVFFYRNGVTPWLHGMMSISGNATNLHYPSISKLFVPFMSLDGIIKLVVVLSGHLFYVTIGTVGLFVLGLLLLVLEGCDIIKSKSNEHDDNAPLLIFLILSISGTLALSAIFMSIGATRLDHFMYGRYLEGVLAPLLLVALLRGTWRQLFWAIPVALMAGFILCYGLHDFGHTARFNISTFWQDFYIRDQSVLIWALPGCLLIVLVGLIPRAFGVGIIAVFFIFNSFLQINWHHAASIKAHNRVAVALELRDRLPKGECIAFDHSGINSYNRHVFWFDFGFVLYDYNLKRIRANRWYSSCEGPLFTYSKDLSFKDVIPTGISPQGGPVLWERGTLDIKSLFPIKVNPQASNLALILQDGWRGFERAHVWSGPESSLKIPLAKECLTTGVCTLRLTFNVFNASKVSPKPVSIDLNGVRVADWIVDTGNIISRKISLPSELMDGDSSYATISIHVPEATSPKALGMSNDARVIGIALREIELLNGDKLENSYNPLQCIQYRGKDTIPSQVGTHTGSGMQTDGRAGYLMFGPYQQIKSGNYTLRVTGKINANSEKVVVDVVGDRGQQTFARFVGLALPENSNAADDVLLEEKVTLDEAVDDLEVRIRVDDKADIFIDGYSLLPVAVPEK